jgi:hypothetical protein
MTFIIDVFQASLILVLLFASYGCADEATQPGSQQVDTRFRDFYDLQGGGAVLGPAIAPMFSDGTRQLQYTLNALLIYDEQLPPGERFNFEPLGSRFGYQDPVLPIPEQPGIRYLNGHVIFAEFVPIFDKLGGLRFAGNPLTEVRLNTAENRYEQYFEKLGFYRKLADPAGTVHLLPYGLIACRANQSETGCEGPEGMTIDPKAYLPQPFVSTFERLGEDFTGKPLSQPYLAADGRLEQVYENLVLSMEPSQVRTIGLRDLPARVGVAVEQAVPALNDPLMVFIELQPGSGLGHNIPRAFLEYIAAHGGNDLAGPPISELREVNGLRRQCFTTYCLDYDPQAPTSANIQLAPLGYEYQKLQGFVPAQLGLRVWEVRPVLRSGEVQTVGVMVYNSTPNQPLANVQPTLELTIPDGEGQNLVFPPTNGGGTSYLNVKLAQAKPGMTIIYKVCVTQPGSGPVCSQDSWLVQ